MAKPTVNNSFGNDIIHTYLGGYHIALPYGIECQSMAYEAIDWHFMVLRVIWMHKTEVWYIVFADQYYDHIIASVRGKITLGDTFL